MDGPSVSVAAPPAPVRALDTRPAGELVDRPDITEAQLLEAIAERLAFERRTGPEPAVVIEAARLGKRKALTFLRQLVLPPPRSRLEMPVQPILREHLTKGMQGSH